MGGVLYGAQLELLRGWDTSLSVISPLVTNVCAPPLSGGYISSTNCLIQKQSPTLSRFFLQTTILIWKSFEISTEEQNLYVRSE